MRKLLNTLYITTQNAYLSLDGENVVVICEEKVLGRVPLHNIEEIVCLSYLGVSPALMGKCIASNILLSFIKPSGQFLARVSGKVNGNVLLRREQYRIADNEIRTTKIAQNFIVGKLYNSKKVIDRAIRDYPLRVEIDKFTVVSEKLKSATLLARTSENRDQLRGYEGEAASNYFSVFDEMILQQKDHFSFQGRSRRPPLDKVNALLSLSYTLLTSMCSSALETVGLDPYVGFMHTDRPGRASLSLDIMEELRPVLSDRFVLSVINKKVLSEKHFIQKENGAVILNDDGRKIFFHQWQLRKGEMITHPFLDEKVEWGLVPFIQAQLLARYIRNDLDEYPPFLWK